MDKQSKRLFKKLRKRVWIFLGVAFPLMLILAGVLYFFAPSLVENQWIVITLMVVAGLGSYFAVNAILDKREAKQAEKPKKHDPFAD